MPYIFFEQYESSDGVSIGLPPCRDVYSEDKEWPTVTKSQADAFNKGDGESLPADVLLPTARTTDEKMKQEDVTLAELGYYFTHVGQPYSKDTSEDRLQYWLDRRDADNDDARKLSKALYPNCVRDLCRREALPRDGRLDDGRAPACRRASGSSSSSRAARLRASSSATAAPSTTGGTTRSRRPKTRTERVFFSHAHYTIVRVALSAQKSASPPLVTESRTP